MTRIAPLKRPHYSPDERFAILAVRAARNWSLVQSAAAFQVTAETIASWTARVTDEGTEDFILLREPREQVP